ncbi:cyclodeaminase/cyclohydrolase family protein [Maribacter sp. 2210JD10-5]|uniref:cyclodeaminase/cyclohydrolase family protein n=1 Tax=Maribacter sp. 2210JD10-5 TaxID=3386272 RepID=UPI0039BCD61C
MSDEKEILRLLDLPANKLLNEFGKGGHIPGSGSAAALSALVGLELVRTVCKLTRKKPQYSDVHAQMKFIEEELESKYKPQVIQIFYNDSIEFGKVSDLRVLRDKEVDKSKKEKLGREAAEQLRKATEIPIELCKMCFKLMEYAIAIFDNGYKATRGDAGVAISNFLSAISGTLFVIMLNIRVAKKSKWTEEKRKESEQLGNDYLKIHREAFKRVVGLYSEGLPDGQTNIPFEQ